MGCVLALNISIDIPLFKFNTKHGPLLEYTIESFCRHRRFSKQVVCAGRKRPTEESRYTNLLEQRNEELKTFKFLPQKRWHQCMETLSDLSDSHSCKHNNTLTPHHLVTVSIHPWLFSFWKEKHQQTEKLTWETRSSRENYVQTCLQLHPT